MAGLLDFLSADDPVTLARLRRQQLDELHHSADLQAEFPHTYKSGATKSDISSLEDDLSQDPYTGDEAQKQEQGRENDLQANADYFAPDVSAVRDAKQRDELAKMLAVPQQQGENALALERLKASNEGAQRDAAYKMMFGDSGSGTPGGLPEGTTKQVHMGTDGMPTVTFNPPKPLGQLENRAVMSFHEAQPLLDELDAQLAGAKSDPLSQLFSKAGNSAEQTLYNHGLGTPNQTKLQLAGLLRVLGSSPYVVGSRHYQMIQQAMAHLTEGSASDAFNKAQVDEIRRLWPLMQDEITQSHANPNAPLNMGAQADPYADPNYRPR